MKHGTPSETGCAYAKRCHPNLTGIRFWQIATAYDEGAKAATAARAALAGRKLQAKPLSTARGVRVLRPDYRDVAILTIDGTPDGEAVAEALTRLFDE